MEYQMLSYFACQDDFSKFAISLKMSFPISQDHFAKMLFLSLLNDRS
jgi:hypothetical protein